MVLCKHIVWAQACKTVEWEMSVPHTGEYVAGLDFLDGEKELPVQKVRYEAQGGLCCIELPAFDTAQLRISYKELERLAGQNGWTLRKV